MRWKPLGCLVALASCAGSPTRSAAPPLCSATLLDIEGNRIWVNREGTGRVTVVFEAGFGNDSSVWSTLTPRIRAAGVQTFVYDRAGMGKSTIDTTAPYSMDRDVHILETALARCGIDGPVLMVGHSYGGAISLLAATRDARIGGVVLVDSVVPHAWPPSVLDSNMKQMRAQYDEIREKAPDLAKVAIPWAEALPATLQRLDGLVIPEALPIIDIVADKGPDDPETARSLRAAHDELTTNHPHRQSILAVGSSHKVMVDRPDLVVDAILKMLETMRAR